MFFMTLSAIISGKIYPSLRIEVQRALRVNCLMNVTSWLTASCHLKRFNPPRSGLVYCYLGNAHKARWLAMDSSEWVSSCASLSDGWP